jgi:hypothetical protein
LKQHNQIASLKNYFLNRARDNTFFNSLVSADKSYTPLNLSDNIISNIVEPNISDIIANIKQKSLHGRYFKELRVLYLQYKIVLSIQEIIKNTYAVYNRSSINVGFAELKGKPLNPSFLLAPFWLKANDIFAKIIHMNLAVKFNLLKDRYTTTLHL